MHKILLIALIGLALAGCNIPESFNETQDVNPIRIGAVK